MFVGDVVCVSGTVAAKAGCEWRSRCGVLRGACPSTPWRGAAAATATTATAVAAATATAVMLAMATGTARGRHRTQPGGCGVEGGAPSFTSEPQLCLHRTAQLACWHGRPPVAAPSPHCSCSLPLQLLQRASATHGMLLSCPRLHGLG